MAEGLLLYQVDSFTPVPYAGNPAGVCLLEKEMSDKWMQAVAADMNLSETAFLFRGKDSYSLRWFTPTVEVNLCGHATLAAAHVLWEENLLEKDEKARFITRSGPLFASLDPPWIEMDFPTQPVNAATDPGGLLAALGIGKPAFMGKAGEDYFIELDLESEVRHLKPNFRAMAKIEARGTIVTAKSSTKGYDFVSRFFAPGYGIDEDPVTGSAHCALGPYWKKKLHKERMFARQVSPRGGELHVIPAEERVFLAGEAVTVFRGELMAIDEIK